MIIDITTVNQEQFLITKHIIAGEECSFIRAKNIMTDWEESNLHLRSCVVNSRGELISASYPKFFNFEEKPAIFPFNGDFTYGVCSFVEKIDGSTLIISKYKDELIIRTRGSIDATAMDNAEEIEFFKKKYSKFFNEYINLCDASWIFEWVSPKNKIIITHQEPELYLTNRISHHDYSLSYQHSLDKAPHGFKRPNVFHFGTLSNMLETVSQFDTMEGVCLYYDQDQHIRKVKSAWYLKAHAFKSRMNLATMLELYLSWKPIDKAAFENKIGVEFDHECLSFAKPIIEELYAKLHLVSIKIHDVKKFVNDNKELSQKDFALKVKPTFSGPLSGMAFTLRKTLDANLDGHIKTLVLEVL